MKKFYGILLCLALMAFKTNLQAQTCAGVTAGAVLLGPTPGSNGLSTTTNDYLVKVILSQTYNQDVTVSGYFYAAAGGLNYDNPFSVIVGAGSLSAQTGQIYTITNIDDPAVIITSVSPCPLSGLSYLKPINSEGITTGNSLYTNFVNATGIFQKYPLLQITDQNLNLITLTDSSLKLIVASISGIGSANKLVAVCNTRNSEYMFYFMEYSSVNDQTTARVYDENNTFIYNTFQTSTTFNLYPGNLSLRVKPTLFFYASDRTGSPSLNVLSCFSSCIHGQQAAFEDTFSGWVIWNTIIAVPVAAAIHCQGSCRGWWR